MLNIAVCKNIFINKINIKYFEISTNICISRNIPSTITKSNITSIDC